MLPSGSRAERVDDVHEQVGVGGDRQRRLERLDELVGQLADEADRVGEQHLLAAGQVEATGGGVEGGEQAVLDEHAGVGEPVEERRLAGVRVADDGDPLGAGPVLGLALRGAVLVDLAQLGLELVDASLDATAIDLELRLARTARADLGAARRRAAALLRQGRALAADARQAVPQEGQLDLGLALLAVGVLGEDVEDHCGPVDGGATEQLLEVALLRRGELVVEHHRVAVGLQRDLAELLGLALADVGGRVGRGAALHEARDLVGAGCVDELRELVEPGFGVLGGVRGEGDAHQDDLLPEGALDQRHSDIPLLTATGCR